MERLRLKLKPYLDKLSIDENDPVEGEKKLVSNIQRLVGVRNVFGGGEKPFSVLSIFAIVIFAGSFLYVGQFSQLVYLIQVFPNKMEAFKVFNCVSATSVPFSKYVFMWTSKSRLNRIFAMSREGLSSIPAGSSARREMLRTLNKARYASWLVVFNQAISHCVYLLMPLLLTLIGNDRYLPTTPGDSYGLTPKYETPFYEATFTLTTTATIFSAVNQTGYIVLFVTLLAHELGHFYAIKETFNDMHKLLIQTDKFDDNVEKQIDEKLKFCITHHQFLIKYHNKIRELYKVIFGAHFLMMTIVLVTTLQTLNVWDVRNTILTGVTGVLPLFIYCFGGELLISAGNEMSGSVYDCGWEFMTVKQARAVLLMLGISQRPLCLTAADIFVMNRETFGNVAQVVYKIYAVFN